MTIELSENDCDDSFHRALEPNKENVAYWSSVDQRLTSTALWDTNGLSCDKANNRSQEEISERLQANFHDAAAEMAFNGKSLLSFGCKLERLENDPSGNPHHHILVGNQSLEIPKKIRSKIANKPGLLRAIPWHGKTMNEAMAYQGVTTTAPELPPQE